MCLKERVGSSRFWLELLGLFVEIDCFDVIEQKIIDIFASDMRIVDSLDHFIQSGDLIFEMVFFWVFSLESALEVIYLFVESDYLIFLLIEESGVIQESCAWSIFARKVYLSLQEAVNFMLQQQQSLL